MIEWLQEAFDSDAQLASTVVFVRQVVAFSMGCAVAGVYRSTRGDRRGESMSMMATLVLLSVLICLITMVIGDNIARAFSLAGALAIVRFRTVVEDTRDTAFVIFAVGLGMAVGAGYLLLPLICIPFAALAAAVFRNRHARDKALVESTLTLQLASIFEGEASIQDTLMAHAVTCRVIAVSTVRQGAAFERQCAVRLREPDSAEPLVRALSRIDGVLSVDFATHDAPV